MLVDLVCVTTADGYQLDGALLRPPTGTPRLLDLDAVCLIHGTGGNFYNSSLFDVFADNLLALGCAVLRVNTRGHDGISTAVTNRGGVRLGAAYETVSDCRHDLAAWLACLRERVGPRAAFLGHSLGAVKCLYAAAQEPQHAPDLIVAVSPPRLSYSWFCASAQGPTFLDDFHKAEALVQAGQPDSLVNVKVPLPMAITAAGYLEKYGPEERYNYTNFIAAMPCPTLVLFGRMEVERNVAFQEGPAAVAQSVVRQPRLSTATIPGADHFYTGVRIQAWQAIEAWLSGAAAPRGLQ